jgi:hypothetical protein
MLSQTRSLSSQVDGRYATDGELEFINHYTQSFKLRLQAYQQLQMYENQIVQRVYEKIYALDSSLLKVGGADFSQKWKQDTLRVLRYSATALLVNDVDTLQERFLSWFQTIMRAFSTQKHCDVTYQLMQDIVRQHLTPNQAELICPILELNRRYLGAK